MFVLNFKLKNRGKALRYAVIAALIIMLVIFAVIKNGGSNAGTATCDEIGEYSLKAETEDQRLELLHGFGIENAANALQLFEIPVFGFIFKCE